MPAIAKKTKKISCFWTLLSCSLIFNIGIIFYFHVLKDNDDNELMKLINNEMVPPEKEKIVTILSKSGVRLTPNMIDSLPSVINFNTMYESEQIKSIYGLDTCASFREKISPVDRIVGPAGLYNTGTNLMYKLLSKHCIFQERADLYDKDATKMKENMNDNVDHQEEDAKFIHNKRTGIFDDIPWGKHSPVQWKDDFYRPEELRINEIFPRVKNENVFPIVMVKDLYTWTGSMCRNPYGAKWLPSSYSCLNLDEEYDKFNSNSHHGKTNNIRLRKRSSMSRMKFAVPEKKKIRNKGGVTVDYQGGKTMKYASLVDMWNNYYNDYLNATFPRLIVRYEDVLLHSNEIIPEICECIGGTIHNNEKGINLIRESAKDEGIFGKTSNLVDSLIRYGDVELRTAHLSHGDMLFAKDHVNMDLMKQFHYNLPMIPSLSSSKNSFEEDEFLIQNPGRSN